MIEVNTVAVTELWEKADKFGRIWFEGAAAGLYFRVEDRPEGFILKLGNRSGNRIQSIKLKPPALTP